MNNEQPTIYVYAPREDSGRTDIKRGTAVISLENSEETSADDLTVYLEDNRHHAFNLTTYMQRLHHAAGRAKENYPTSSKKRIPKGDLELIATFTYPEEELASRISQGEHWSLVLTAIYPERIKEWAVAEFPKK